MKTRWQTKGMSDVVGNPVGADQSAECRQLVTICHQLKLPAADGKNYLTDVASAESVDATGMTQNQAAAKTGGRIAKKARLELEAKTGQKVVTAENYLPPAKAAKKIT